MHSKQCLIESKPNTIYVTKLLRLFCILPKSMLRMQNVLPTRYRNEFTSKPSYQLRCRETVDV